MNDKVNKVKKLKDFKNFKVNSKLMSYAKKDAIFFIVYQEDQKFQ